MGVVKTYIDRHLNKNQYQWVRDKGKDRKAPRDYKAMGR